MPLPSFPIVDTHVHLWDTRLLRYPWLDELPPLNRPFLPDDYRQACGPVEVEHLVHLQCEVEFSQYLRELDFVTELAEREPRLRAIIPWAPLEKGEAARTELEALARHPLVKGVRRIIQFEPEPDFCLQPDFVRGVQLLADTDLHVELCLKGDEQFRHAIELVRRCPDVRFILDHIGKPFIKEGVAEPWKSLMAELADRPNAWCKLSGLVTEAAPDAWTPADLKPYIDWTIACFGWDRVMYGSDWPVVTLAASYPRWVETLADAVQEATPGQRRRLFRDNAVSFYRL